ncbi:MAG: hypothetical protein CMP76_02080, partial [Flavobacterium sp.]|nr:hypothetical protein [Flavobacterium sp.]
MTNMKQKITLLLFMISFLSWEGNAQTQFWSDTFEDVGAPSSGTRTPENDGGGVFSTPYPSYFARVTNSDIDLFFGSYSGQEGSKFWAAEDNDGAFGSGNEEQQIDFTNINISGKTGLSFKGLFAANNQNAAFESLAFGFTHSDYIIVEYQIDGGPYVPLIRFFANNSVGTGVNNKSLAEELSGDEIGEGTILTTSFGEFTKTIPATGTILNLRIRVFTNGGSEEIAFDNFRLFEAPVCTNPTVPTLAASANPVCNSASTTLNITGTLNDATQWAIYTGSCGGSLVGTTATSTFVVTPTGPSTTYYVRGEGGCVTPGSCGSITINVSTVSL